MPDPARAIASLLAVAVVVGGCTVSSTKKLHFPSEEMLRLDGLRPGQEVALETTDGTVVEVASGMTLRFDRRGHTPLKLRCERIDIEGTRLSCVEASGLADQVDLAQSDAYILVRTSKTSWKRTALIILGVYVAVGLLAAIAG